MDSSVSRHSFRIFCAVAIFALLAACSQPPAPTAQTMRAPDHDIVASIRAAGTRDSSVVEVAPLRNPAVDGMLNDAHNAERAGNVDAAIAKTDAALQLAPNAPDILQYRAELAVRANDYPTAENDARHSYSLGPKLGGLCMRNWQTVLEIEQLKGNAAAVQNARIARDKCHVQGPIRM
ncbi:MAG: tetratricopeptide repeat protein [Pseudomonadota bacterium]|nr:tetratricopeptide repeat protein [Pseudomonadota bacterium]